MQIPEIEASPSKGYVPPTTTVLGTLAELTQLGAGTAGEALSNGPSA